ncbi:MAG TPA: hypothetical protein EYP90_12515, partial [Chromatiaceae bacterium]|nr:hypothetical protein [Chromatiaceae bacterium]
MSIFILAYRIDSLTYTIAKAVSFGGWEVCIQAITQEHTCDLDRRLVTMLDETPHVTVNDPVAPRFPGKDDLLIIQGHPRIFEHRGEFLEFSKNAGSLVMISTGDRKIPYRKALSFQWRELRWYGARLFRVKRVLFKDGFYPRDLFGLIRPRSVIGFDVHSKFLHDPGAFQRIHARDWKPDRKRPLLINFLGSRDPQRRERIVDSIEPLLENPRIQKLLDRMGKQFFWHLYSDEAPRVLSESEYLKVLTESDFTLSPPGFSLVTHRPLEALLRGSIPVLHASELDLYDVGFADGINCIAVPSEGWPAAVERILSLPEEDIWQMRRN